MKKSLNLKSIVVLTSICAVISLLLAATNALSVVLPSGTVLWYNHRP